MQDSPFVGIDLDSVSIRATSWSGTGDPEVVLNGNGCGRCRPGSPAVDTEIACAFGARKG